MSAGNIQELCNEAMELLKKVEQSFADFLAEFKSIDQSLESFKADFYSES